MPVAQRSLLNEAHHTYGMGDGLSSSTRNFHQGVCALNARSTARPSPSRPQQSEACQKLKSLNARNTLQESRLELVASSVPLQGSVGLLGQSVEMSSSLCRDVESRLQHSQWTRCADSVGETVSNHSTPCCQNQPFTSNNVTF
eukprot:612514-Amphidinium_carterae.1